MSKNGNWSRYAIGMSLGLLVSSIPVSATEISSAITEGDSSYFPGTGSGIAEAIIFMILAAATIWKLRVPEGITLRMSAATTTLSRIGNQMLRGHPARNSVSIVVPKPAERPANQPASCRFCGTALARSLIDLGAQPLSNCYLRKSELAAPEPTWPLHALICEACLLVQIDANEAPERIFTDYAYFSSYSASWLKHSEEYSSQIIERLGLSNQSQVVEIASNDGYLLKNFVRRGIPSLGIEPAANIACVAVGQGIPTRNIFLNTTTARQLAAEGYAADLLIGNNVLAHVPTLNDFVEALRILLKPSGTLTMEFPHLLRLIEDTQFDTIYHEHFSYFSLLAARKVFEAHGLKIFDVECLPTHGGSLRIYAARQERKDCISRRVDELVTREQDAGLENLETYDRFAERVRKTKRRLMSFLIDAKENNKTIIAYGAAAKGNTLLNYCGARSDIIDYVADANPHKQGQYLPGTRIPIVAPSQIRESRPDYVLILPWNLKDEIMEHHDYIREWGGQFIVPVPDLRIIP